MNVAVVEDNREDLERLVMMLRDYSAVSESHFSVAGFGGADELLEDYKPLQFTVIFLDIYMNGLTGIDTAKKIRETDRDTFIVFITSADDRRADAFRVHAFDYIEKPVEKSEIYRVMDDILRRTTSDDGGRMSFVSDKREYSVRFDDIVLIRTDGQNYLEINTCRGDAYRTRMTVTAAETVLKDDERFLTVARGNIVNMDYITGFDGDVCELSGGIRLPVSMRGNKKIQQIWRNWKFAKIRSEALKGGGG